MTQHKPVPEDLVEEAVTWFVRLRSDDSTPTERQQFQRWLEQSAAHQAAYNEAEALWQDLGYIPQPSQKPIPTSIPLPTSSSQSLPSGMETRWWRSGLAACLALLLGAWFWHSGTLENATATYYTSIGEIRQINLSDGSTLYLNTDSAVTIAFTEACRCLDLLRGEAYFEVSKDPQRRFAVHSRNGQAIAVGTAFSVRKLSQSTRIEVTEGTVKVEHAVEGSAPDQSLLLRAGNSAVYNQQGSHHVSNQSLSNTAAWRYGKLVIRDRPLSEVVRELDRYYPGKILLLSASSNQQLFSGVLNLNDMEQALSALEQTQALSILQITPLLTVLRTTH